jgi:hypothetical protein
MNEPPPTTDFPTPANTDPAGKKSTVRKVRLSKTALHWLLEGLLIVVSVLLAFGLNGLRENQAERELTSRVLNGILAEIEYNLQVLEPYVPMHSQWMETLQKQEVLSGDQAALDVWFATRPAFPNGVATPFPSLRRSAWDAAVSGDALRLLDYDVTAALTDVYGSQELVTANIDRLAGGALSLPEVYDPAARDPSVRLLWLSLADIQFAESLLLSSYGKHLPTITSTAQNLRR